MPTHHPLTVSRLSKDFRFSYIQSYTNWSCASPFRMDLSTQALGLGKWNLNQAQGQEQESTTDCLHREVSPMLQSRARQRSIHTWRWSCLTYTSSRLIVKSLLKATPEHSFRPTSLNTMKLLTSWVLICDWIDRTSSDEPHLFTDMDTKLRQVYMCWWHGR